MTRAALDGFLNLPSSHKRAALNRGFADVAIATTQSPSAAGLRRSFRKGSATTASASVHMRVHCYRARKEGYDARAEGETTPATFTPPSGTCIAACGELRVPFHL